MFIVRTKLITICMIFMLSIAASTISFSGDAAPQLHALSVFTPARESFFTPLALNAKLPIQSPALISSTSSLPVHLNHESGNFSEYDVYVTDSGDLAVSRQSGLDGTAYGLSILVDDANRAYAEKVLEAASTTGVVRARFHIDPNGLEMGNLAQVSFLFFINSDGKSNFALMKLMKLQGYYFLRGVMIDDNGVHRETELWPITDAPHFVEIRVRRSSSAASQDATYETWIDGYPRVMMTGVDSYERFSDLKTISAGLNGVAGAVKGIYYLDEIMVNEDGSVIGPIYGDSISPTPTMTAPTRPAKTPTPTPTIGPAVTPGVPELIAPAKGVLVATLRPTLDWEDTHPLAPYYQVQVTTHKKFIAPVTGETNALKSVFTPISDLLPGTLYYWRVRAFNAEGNPGRWSVARTFKTPLAQPKPAAPSYGEFLLTDRPVFRWDALPGATSYVLQVSSRDTFSSLLVNATVNVTEYIMSKDLPQNKILYWRLQGRSVTVKGPWSEKWMFKTGNPPSVPGLAAPANGALVKDYTPRLNWNDSKVPSGAMFKHYELQVDDQSDFSKPVIQTTTVDSEFTPPSNLVSNTKFYWRVRAVNSNDHTSAWSLVWSFRTVIPAPQGLTITPNDLKPLQPGFSWEAATGAGMISGYTIQISTSAKFNTLLVNSTTQDSKYAMRRDLPSGKTLYWRVRVNGVNGPSAWTTQQYVTP